MNRSPCFLIATACLLTIPMCQVGSAEKPPNVVFIMSDELAYYELSHMGNPRIQTPRIDQMAREGIRFTQALAGSPVCAPLRCNLMTGKHAGHASVRANDGGTPLRAGEPTIATMLKQLGYATGGFGKWGCGGRDSTGVPEQHGFDVFFGYYDQVHAHSFYPPYLVRNSQEVPLAGNDGGRQGDTYSHYPIVDAALQFIRDNRERPFFCYMPITPPHGMYDIPADDPAWELYQDAEWMQDASVSQDAKNYAAMVSMVDRNLGQVLDLLAELKLEDNTIVFFTGDNGGQDRFKSQEYPRGYFGPNVDPRTGTEFRGGKGNLYEGGLRIPFIVRWPNKIPGDRVSDLVFYQPDVLPTLAELTGAAPPEDIDGLSILPELLGQSPQPQHDFLYWEFGPQTAVRQGNWKAIQPKPNGPWELYDLSQDPSEQRDVAAEQPELLQAMQGFAKEAHEPVQPGRYLDPMRTRHERDRQAKWGFSKQGQPAAPSMNRLTGDDLIPAAQMRLHAFSSENRGNDRRAEYAIDGKPGTVWHSQFSGKLEQPPHELVIDLGATYSVRGLRYLARQDAGWNGAFGKVEFSISSDPQEWPAPAATTEFKKTKKMQAVECENPATGRYVRVRILSEVNGNPWASAAEIGVVGDPAGDSAPVK